MHDLRALPGLDWQVSRAESAKWAGLKPRTTFELDGLHRTIACVIEQCLIGDSH